MRKFVSSLLALLCLVGSAQAGKLANIVQDRRLVSSDAFFPQINPQGTRLLYSPTEGTRLYMLALDSTEQRTLVAQGNGMPGFDARISATTGHVYYITQQPTAQRILLRSVHEWDERTGRDRVVIKGQHGAVHALQGTRGMAVVSEHTTSGADTAGTCVWTLGADMFVLQNGRTRTLRPVPTSVGLLWASVSPDGQKILFEAAGKGLYICDLSGRILAQTRQLLFPSWLGNDYVVAQTHANRIILLKADFSSEQTLTGSNCIQPMVAGDNIVYTTKRGTVYWMRLSFGSETSSSSEGSSYSTNYDDIKEVHTNE